MKSIKAGRTTVQSQIDMKTGLMKFTQKDRLLYNEKETHEPAESIYMYMRCPMCLEQLENAEDKYYGRSIRDLQQLDFGFTHGGFQVWCNRHEINVIHISRAGADLPVDVSVYGTLEDSRKGRVQSLSSLKQSMYDKTQEKKHA